MCMGKGLRIAVILFILFFLIAFSYDIYIVQQADELVKKQFDKLQNDKLTGIFQFFSLVGSKRIIIPLYFCLLLLMCSYSRWDFAAAFTLNTFAVRYVNAKLKLLFSRERPSWEHFTIVTDFSFPSGHAMNAAAFYGYIAICLLQSRFPYRKMTAVIFLSVIFLIGISRIYLGVHFPTDVVAGWAAGGVWAVCSYELTRCLKKYMK